MTQKKLNPNQRKRSSNPIPFNHEVPPIFNHESGSSLIDKELSYQIRFLAGFGDNQTTWKEWNQAYKKAEYQLMEECWLFRRLLGHGERSQLEWLRECGHAYWFAEDGKIRLRMDKVMDEHNAWYDK
jgi:hypothetical protein